MKTPLLILATAALLAPALCAADDPIPRDGKKLSLRNEVQLAIDKGLRFLKTKQLDDGSWSDVDPVHPALTALPLVAFQREPSGKYLKDQPEFMRKGYAFLRGKVQPDGGIYTKGLSNYNTSTALMALLNSGEPKDEPLLKAAKDFIVSQQAKGLTDPSLDGGISYGPTGTSRQHPDLDNHLVALEALRAFKASRQGIESAGGKDLNWQAAIDFISRSQNLTATNKEKWASDDPANKGGFIYFPGDSKAGEMKLPDGRVALRSYGSMSYAGLLSFIYADVKKDDQRVVAALDWLKKNYTLKENPGMERAGLFYYYHLMTKALAAADVKTLDTPHGKVDWASELALKLISVQAGDGSWVNDTARWMEKDPILVTTYCVLSLEIIFHRL